MKIVFKLVAFLGLAVSLKHSFSSDFVYYASSMDMSEDLDSKKCDIGAIKDALNQTFMEEVLNILRRKPLDVAALDCLYLASDIAEEYLKNDESFIINCRLDDYLPSIITIAKEKAQQIFLDRTKVKQTHGQKMKNFNIKNHCELWGWDCPDFE